MEQDYTKAPRIFLPHNLSDGAQIPLAKDHTHYLLNVMRKGDGDRVRIFNGKDGEYVGQLNPTSKKSCSLINLKQIKKQQVNEYEIHLYFAPIKKDRMGFMIEKIVELGVTDIHPVITDRTQHGKINIDKIQKQIIEASEQCERMDIPTLHPAEKLMHVQFPEQTYVGLERDNAPLFTPVSLGNKILRAETASLFMLSRIDTST
jgi:16S rRNA (uracil1498-N3)-methyltransferase